MTTAPCIWSSNMRSARTSRAGANWGVADCWLPNTRSARASRAGAKRQSATFLVAKHALRPDEPGGGEMLAEMERFP